MKLIYNYYKTTKIVFQKKEQFECEFCFKEFDSKNNKTRH